MRLRVRIRVRIGVGVRVGVRFRVRRCLNAVRVSIMVEVKAMPC